MPAVMHVTALKVGAIEQGTAGSRDLGIHAVRHMYMLVFR